MIPAAKALLALLSFVTTVMITRSLGAEDFGVYATAINLMLILAGLVGHTLDAGVFRLVPPLLEKNQTQAELVLREAFGLRIVAGVGLIVLLTFPAAIAGNSLLKSADWPQLWALLAVGILATLALGHLMVQLQVSQQFRGYLVFDAAQVVGRLSLIEIGRAHV